MEIKKIYKYGYMELEGECSDKTFFCSDLHFDHKNIIRLCNRPFSNVDEMNQTLINNWNNIVTEDGLVFILGDFCWSGDPFRWKRLLEKLNGKKVLIKGNHDDYKVLEKIEDQFITIRERLELRIEDTRVMLDHYPMKEWSGSFRGVFSLYGHTHQNDILLDKPYYHPSVDPRMLNVGVDNWNFLPISFGEIKKTIEGNLIKYKK